MHFDTQVKTNYNFTRLVSLAMQQMHSKELFAKSYYGNFKFNKKCNG